MSSDAKPVEMEVIAKGPIICKGTITLTLADGTVETREGNTALCRCGASSNKPLCDGSHRKVDFE